MNESGGRGARKAAEGAETKAGRKSGSATGAGARTRERILDTAERLFAEKGFAETSLRLITAEAGVNLAAVHYHYKSKDALLQAVFSRRMAPLNRRRLEELDACLKKAGSSPPLLEDVLKAMISPVLRLKAEPENGGEHFSRLLGRAIFAPEEVLIGVLYREFKDVFMRYTEVFQEIMPEMPAEEIFWRAHFLAGCISFSMVNPKHLTMTSGGLCDPMDAEAAIDELSRFAAAGFRAPAQPARLLGTKPQ